MTKKWFFYISSTLTICLIFLCRDYILFWDTVQFAGKHSLWFFENGWNQGRLPSHLDSGHPPTFGFYIATLFTIFEQSIQLAHFAMLPFLIANLYFIIRIGHYILGKNYWLFAIAILISPFYLGHSILVSPDLVLISGFLMCLCGILESKKYFLIAGSVLLALISMRGSFVLGGLMLYAIIGQTTESSFGTKIKQATYSFIPAIFIIISFQVWHYFTQSWVGFHEDSPWADSFTVVSLKTLIRNSGIYIWRLIDYGMVVPYLIVLWQWKKIWNEKNRLILLALILGIIFFLIVIPFNGLLNHRYFLPIQIVVLLLAFYGLSSKSKIYGYLVILSLAASNFLIYPDKVGQGWDSTFAHIHFYEMEQKMFDYINKSNTMEINKIGTAFPLDTKRKFLNFSTGDVGYGSYDLSQDKYVLYSNIMNDFSDEELDILQTWKSIKSYRSFGVKLILYQRPD